MARTPSISLHHPHVTTPRHPRQRWRILRTVAAVLTLCFAGSTTGRLAATAVAQPAAEAGGQMESVRTSDGVNLALWYYPAATEQALGTVVLVHDLESSHAALEPLALGLQAAGMSVVAPDLRGHGESTNREWPNGRTDELEAERLRKGDLDAITVTQGGRVREQATLRGDLETVYGWIRRTARADQRLAADQLCIVGSGLGGTLASLWTAKDAAWPPLASGPQGRNVQAICLISPVFALKGATIGPALQTQTLSRDLPLVILAGERDRDATRIFNQLKGKRSDAWFEQKADGSTDKASAVENPTTDASLFLLTYGTTETGDALATAGSQTFIPLLVDFFSKQLAK